MVSGTLYTQGSGYTTAGGGDWWGGILYYTGNINLPKGIYSFKGSGTFTFEWFGWWTYYDPHISVWINGIKTAINNNIYTTYPNAITAAFAYGPLDSNQRSASYNTYQVYRKTNCMSGGVIY